MKNKRGSLSLSIEAIVIIVIAFVILGLALTLTRIIFKGGTEKIPEALDLTALESQPTSENPITIPDTLKVDRGSSPTEKLGFYNKGEGTAFGATVTIVDCLDKNSEPVEVDSLPTISSISQNVGASSSGAFSVIINENGLPADTYICTIGVKCNPEKSEEGCPDWAKDVNGELFYEIKTFFLKVVA
ncbi:MAG TPA: hypothetical protein VJG31_04350 [Candidatus Nanoarchaeia archaeon]|nr:hypothetical protein [Candidatus Nanoarchaeia archaeon]